jgi:hypothetical protein
VGTLWWGGVLEGDGVDELLAAVGGDNCADEIAGFVPRLQKEAEGVVFSEFDGVALLGEEAGTGLVQLAPNAEMNNKRGLGFRSAAKAQKFKFHRFSSIIIISTE